MTQTTTNDHNPSLTTSVLTKVGLGRRDRRERVHFGDLEGAKTFYVETPGLQVSDEQPGHYAKFGSDAGFVCLERKGAESYPSSDKEVLFLEAPDLEVAINALGQVGWYAGNLVGRTTASMAAVRLCTQGQA